MKLSGFRDRIYMMHHLKKGVRRTDRKLTQYALQMPQGLTIS